MRVLAIETPALGRAAFSRPRTDAVRLFAEAHFAVAARVFFLESRNFGLSELSDLVLVLDCVFAVLAFALRSAYEAFAKALAVELEAARPAT